MAKAGDTDQSDEFKARIILTRAGDNDLRMRVRSRDCYLMDRCNADDSRVLKNIICSGA